MFLKCNFLSGPDHRLVRLLGRVSPLECEDFLLFHRIIQFDLCSMESCALCFLPGEEKTTNPGRAE